nr:ribokinase [Hymenolepis microstoma]
MDITIVGDIMNDLFTYSTELPVVGETIVGDIFQSCLGGTGANQAVAASKLGAKVSLIATVGADPFGSYCIESLNKAGICTSAISQSTNRKTGVGMIMVNSRTGENQIVAVLGANDEVAISDVDHAVQSGKFSRKLFSCQFESNAETSLYALEKAHSEGVLTLLDPAPGPTPDSPFYHLLPRFLAAATVASPNELEASALTGEAIPCFGMNATSDEILEGTRGALVALRKFGVKYPIITLADKGAASILPASEVHHPLPLDICVAKKRSSQDAVLMHIKAPSVKNVIDSTGAGDCFTGSLAFYMSRYPHLSMMEKIRRAVWIAAQSVKRCGTQSSYPNRDELPNSIFHEKEEFQWPNWD